MKKKSKSKSNRNNHKGDSSTSNVHRTVGHEGERMSLADLHKLDAGMVNSLVRSWAGRPRPNPSGRKDHESNDGTLNKLVKGRDGTPLTDLKTTNRDWHIDVATLLDAKDQAKGDDTKSLIDLTILHSYYKAAAIDDTKAAEQGRQISPFLAHAFRYHRSVDNMLNYQAHVAYEVAMGFRTSAQDKMVSYQDRFLNLVSNDTFGEVMSREYNTPGISPSDLSPTSQDAFKNALGEMFDNVAGMTTTSTDSPVMFDVSAMLANKLGKLSETTKQQTAGKVNALAGELQQAFSDKLGDYLANKDWTGGDSNVDPNQAKNTFLDNLNRVAIKTQIMGFIQDGENTVMVTPDFLNKGLPAMDGRPQGLVSSHGEFRESVNESIKGSGYRLDPASAMSAWLTHDDVGSIFGRHDFSGRLAAKGGPLPMSSLATGSDKLATGNDATKSTSPLQSLKGSKLIQKLQDLTAKKTPATSEPTSEPANEPATNNTPSGTKPDLRLDSLKNLKDSSIFSKFKELGSESNTKFDDTPYVRVLAQATSESLNKLDPGIDAEFAARGLSGLLETSLSRMAIAMGEAQSFPGDFFHFTNQIELIHQQISMLLTFAQPYNDAAFGSAVIDAMKDTIPASLQPMANAQLYPSAMHTAASTLSSVEAQKGSNDLTVAVLKDSYYETTASDPGHSGIVFKSRTYDAWQVDGDTLANNAPLGDQSLQKPNGGGNLQDFTDSGKKLDVFIADFRHNISPTRQVYATEDLAHQVDQLFSQDLVQDHFTVAIDNTIDHLASSDVKAFLDHNQDRIADGSLNVVIFKSAQKFDMLGIDNYYGGYAVAINNPASYGNFNGRMFDPKDGLGGLNRQGLTHNMTSTPTGSQDVTHPLDSYRGGIMANTQKLYDGLPAGLKHDPAGGAPNPKNPTRVSDLSSVSVIQNDNKQVFIDIKFPKAPDAKMDSAFQGEFEQSLLAFAKANHLPLDQRSSFGFATSNLTVIPGIGVRFNPGLEDGVTIGKYIQFFNNWYNAIDNALSNLGPGENARAKAMDAVMALRAPPRS